MTSSINLGGAGHIAADACTKKHASARLSGMAQFMSQLFAAPSGIVDSATIATHPTRVCCACRDFIPSRALIPDADEWHVRARRTGSYARSHAARVVREKGT